MGSSELTPPDPIPLSSGPRIGFLYGMQIDRPRGGGTIHGYQLARHLSALGAQLSSWYFDAGETQLVHGYRGRELLRFVREIDCLYLRIEWSNVSSTLSWLKALRLGALPVIWELNGTPAELQFSESASAIAGIVSRLRRNARACDAAIGVSEEVVDFARTDLRIDNVHCIPNGSDPDLFMPRGDAEVRAVEMRLDRYVAGRMARSRICSMNWPQHWCAPGVMSNSTCSAIRRVCRPIHHGTW
jgi:hypothetical protein